jgi:hypothetical protein
MTDRDMSGRTDADGEDADRAAFAERIARPLRTPEQLDITFEARVMSAVQAEARAGHVPGADRQRAVIGWWLHPRLLRVSPLRMLAAAAALVGLTLLGSQAMPLLMGPDIQGSASAPDTVHVVRFVLLDPQARSVSLVGDFNAWRKDATPLDATGESGVWVVSSALPAGRHEYAFIVDNADGERWVADPFAATARDEFDTASSVIMVGNVGAAAEKRNAS